MERENRVVTLFDVAKAAGVSPAAASFALSGTGSISPEVRQKVITQAELLGYRRRRSRQERKAQRRWIGIIHREQFDLEWQFFHPFFALIESRLSAEGFYPVLLRSESSGSEEDTDLFFRRIVGSGVEGILSIQYGNRQLFEMLEQAGVPVVILNNNNYQDRFHSVLVDDFQGAYEGAKYLLELGHRQITFVEYTKRELPGVISDRFIGFRKALEENSVPFDISSRMTLEQPDVSHIEAFVASFLRFAPPSTAIFAHDDYLAAHIHALLAGRGKRIPGDVSLIAPGDVLPYGLPFIPGITTMRIDNGVLGKLACDLLFRLVGGVSGAPQVLKVKQQLVDRGSCAPPSGG